MTKKMKKLVDNLTTMEDFKQAIRVQHELNSVTFKPSDNLRLCDALITFDEVSTANIYHLQLIHKPETCKEAISCLTYALHGLCEFWLICSSGDFATRILVVSHMSPCSFEKVLTNKYDNVKTSSLSNIIF